MTTPATTKKLLLALGCALGSALLATACTVTLDPNGLDEEDETQCLELFETCVELAGDSPGCDAVFEYCTGNDSGGDEGGPEPEPGCEEEYIGCLAEGLPPEVCEPILDECYPDPDPTGGDEGGCMDPDDPECDPCADGSCEPGLDCDHVLWSCQESGLDDMTCAALAEVCYDGGCESALNVCYDYGYGEECPQITGCGGDPEPPPPVDDCELLINQCLEETGELEFCQEIHPECFGDEPEPPMPGNCEWYWGECEAQFAPNFCQDAAQACEIGLFPEQFDCSLVFPDGCSGVSDQVCEQAGQACENGFYETELCASIVEDLENYLPQLAECNGWE